MKKCNVLAAKDVIYESDEATIELRYPIKRKRYDNLDLTKDGRTVYQHDCDAILYSHSFRRLMHKTQVTYPGLEKNEHTRTRLTHTLEVNQIARSIASYFDLNLDLITAISLGHDVGHTPFGHEGEEFLNNVCHGRETWGTNTQSIKEKYNLPDFNFDFKHNYQSVRILTYWEGNPIMRKDGRKQHGLNISWVTLEGILKHSKIRYTGDENNLYNYPEIISGVMYEKLALNKDYCIHSLEGQIVALADEIAQVTHDLEDAITANYSVKDILLKAINNFLNTAGKDEENRKLHKELINQTFILKYSNQTQGVYYKINEEEFPEFISWVIGYLILRSQKVINENISKYIEDKTPIEYFPLTEDLANEKIVFKNNELYELLQRIEYTYTINNIRINRENGKSEYVLKSILEAYLNNPTEIPDAILIRYSRDDKISPYVRKKIQENCIDDKNHPNVRYAFKELKGYKRQQFIEKLRNDPVFLRCVIDGIASMTDQYALNEYKMLYLGDTAYREV